MRWLALPLAVGCGLLALSSAFGQENAPGSREPRPLQAPPGAAIPWLKLDDLTATRQRPLFTPNRRPESPTKPPPAAAPPQPEPERRPEFALKGIVSQGTSTFVLLEDMISSETVLVREGETIGDWRIQVESARSVTLVGQSERIKLQMFEEDNADSE